MARLGETRSNKSIEAALLLLIWTKNSMDWLPEPIGSVWFKATIMTRYFQTDNKWILNKAITNKTVAKDVLLTQCSI